MSAVQTRGLGFGIAARWTGLLGGLAAASWLLSLDVTGSTLFLLGPLVGLGLLVGVLLGELAAPGPERGASRRALLETRRVADYLPAASRRLVALLSAYAGVTVLLLAGRRNPVGEGSGLENLGFCTGDRIDVGPWPDWLVILPALLAVIVGLGIAAATLHLLVRRGRPGGIDVAEDDRRRRDTAAAVVAACTVLVGAALCNSALPAGAALTRNCGVPGQGIGWLVLWVGATGALVGCWSAVALLVPRRAR